MKNLSIDYTNSKYFMYFPEVSIKGTINGKQFGFNADYNTNELVLDYYFKHDPINEDEFKIIIETFLQNSINPFGKELAEPMYL